MRQVTNSAAQAFKKGTTFCRDNTQVVIEGINGDMIRRMYLHGSEIACDKDGMLYLTLAGWPTPTTRERLNGLLDVLGYKHGFYQMKGEQHFIGSGEDSRIDAHQWLRLPSIIDEEVV